MNHAVMARVIRIGNSQGIRIPKPLLEQSGIGDLVELVVQEGQICIRPAHRVREGWDEQFAEMARHGDDRLPDGDWPPSSFDQDEWTW